MRTVNPREKGAILIISLIVLTLMTLIGAAAMRSSILEEKMARNWRDRERAFQAAEAALRAGENLLRQAVLPPFDGGDGLYQPPPPEAEPYWRRGGEWWRSHGASHSGRFDDVVEPPRYIVEELPPTPALADSLAAGRPIAYTYWYRITARGVGGSPSAVVFLRTTYQR
jgi:type IV pilus assembly protein PilX